MRLVVEAGIFDPFPGLNPAVAAVACGVHNPASAGVERRWRKARQAAVHTCECCPFGQYFVA